TPIRALNKIKRTAETAAAVSSIGLHGCRNRAKDQSPATQYWPAARSSDGAAARSTFNLVWNTINRVSAHFVGATVSKIPFRGTFSIDIETAENIRGEFLMTRVPRSFVVIAVCLAATVLLSTVQAGRARAEIQQGGSNDSATAGAEQAQDGEVSTHRIFC